MPPSTRATARSDAARAFGTAASAAPSSTAAASSTSSTSSGPLLVSLGAAGWGAENLFRSRLGGLGLAAFPIVFFEHVLQVLFTLPIFLRQRHALRRVPALALFYVFLSGALGSALGTVCYTSALVTVNPTVAAVLLNLQPVVSTVAGALLFSERIPLRFYPFAALAVLAGAGMCLPAAHTLADLHVAASLNGGLALVFCTILCWGCSTAFGRGAMRDLPLGLGAPLRLMAGLLATGAVIAVRALGGNHEFQPSHFLTAAAIKNMLLLTTLTGAVPLFVYFAGLARTPASVAGYCEMFYTVSAVLIGWLFLGGTLLIHQAVAAAVLLFAIVQLNRARPALPPVPT